jgi:aspartyl-tRNA synthetase
VLDELGTVGDEKNRSTRAQSLDRLRDDVGVDGVEIGGGSSRITNGASRTKALARAILRRSPADSARPPSPTRVS